MANKVEITTFPDKTLAEIYQDIELKFAFVTRPAGGYKQCHPFVKCRDFLQDAVAAEVNKEEVDIYDFVYKSGVNPPMSLNKMRMLVKKISGSTAETFSKQMASAEKLLKHYEGRVGWKETQTFDVKGKTSIKLFVSDKGWIKAPHMVSLYTLLIRLGAYYPLFENDEELQKEYARIVRDNTGKGKYGGDPVDIRYLAGVKLHINTIMENMDKLVFNTNFKNYPKVATSTMHNRGGIVSLCGKYHFSKELNERLKSLSKGGK